VGDEGFELYVGMVHFHVCRNRHIAATFHPYALVTVDAASGLHFHGLFVKVVKRHLEMKHQPGI
jgi:hypothetical protein